MKELERIADENQGISEALIRYLLGRNDFYNVITDEPRTRQNLWIHL